MMYDEFIKLTGSEREEFTPSEYHMFVEPFYAHGSDIPDVGGKEVFAAFFASNRVAFGFLRNNLRAIAKAERDNFDRDLELSSWAKNLTKRDDWIVKKEESYRAAVEALRESLSI